MPTKPSGERVLAGNRRAEVWQVAKIGSGGAAEDGPAARACCDQHVVPRMDRVARRMAWDCDAVDDVISPSSRSWPRIFPGL